MFEGCSNLEWIKVNFTDWGGLATQAWVSGVASDGLFICPD